MQPRFFVAVIQGVVFSSKTKYIRKMMTNDDDEDDDDNDNDA